MCNQRVVAGGTLTIPGSCLCFFADDAVLFASLNNGLQLALGGFAAESDAAGMRISIL